MKKIIFILLCCISNAILAQSIESRDLVVRPNYKLEEKRSDISFNSDDLLKLLIEDNNFNKFFLEHKDESLVYFSSLIKFKFKDTELQFDKINSRYKPNSLLENFIKKNVDYLDFRNCEGCRVGCFFSFDIENLELFIEFVEIKKKKFYLIFNKKEKISNEPVTPKSNCSP